MSLPGYDKVTGCIEFPELNWSNWSNRWLDQKPEKFYGYLKKGNHFVGEVALRQVEDNTYMISIIIEGSKRGNGYGKKGLVMLIDYAFNQLGATLVMDEFEQGRNVSDHLFKELGFETKKQGDLVIYSLSKDQYKKGAC